MFESKNRFLTHMRNDLCRKKKESLCVDKVSSNLACTGHGSRHNCTNVGAKHGAQSVHPFTLVESYLQTVTKSIKEDLRAVDSELLDVSEYYFDGQGKLFRPMLVMLMAKAVNFHTNQMDRLLSSQEKIAVIAEMIHTASLMHDDVIDAADSRRGKPSINQVFGHRKSILGGDFVMAMASIALARIRDEEVVSVVAQITEDLVRGEFMQLGSKEKEDERFTHYLNKSFKKTASLLANSCKAVAILSHCDEGIEEIAYDYGKNVGISFQLIDDLLDFTSCDLVMGKPTAADLRLGLATAPVLFAAKKFPELNAMIMRRFSEKGDVETARELVAQSDGIEQTRQLAHEHSAEAVRQIRTLTESRYVTGLEMLANIVLSRKK
ncbi:all trans-polyprenyl-diphosphate synthase PDSS1-like [Mya arenaria]|uniref:all trans-polyprenyl-diphosphate synthase PDSS1-like n=1 Tax=Mya arenaria TaxID=6604 RepID=UPI0022DFE925|nr:all trans-polyprenyl-diphosphate synthase PDSS1-like [Mya arenaria]